jgi:hypothetical protein
VLLKDTFIIETTYRQMEWWLNDDEFERIWKEAFVTKSMYYPKICPQRQRNLSQGSRCPGWVSNLATPRVLPLNGSVPFVHVGFTRWYLHSVDEGSAAGASEVFAISIFSVEMSGECECSCMFSFKDPWDGGWCPGPGKWSRKMLPNGMLFKGPRK